MPPDYRLITAGVRELGDFCAQGEGGAWLWVDDFDVAVGRFPRLALKGREANRDSWMAVLEWLEDAAVEPVEPSPARDFRGGLPSSRDLEAQMAAVARVDLESLEQLKVVASGGVEETVEVWRGRLAAVSSKIASQPVEWEAGRPDPSVEACGPFVVWDLGGDIFSSGGVGGWLSTPGVAANGWLEDWESRYASLRNLYATDGEGFLMARVGGDFGDRRLRRLSADELDFFSLPSPIRAFAEARYATCNLPMVGGPPIKDTSRSFINVDVASTELDRVLEMCAKFNLSDLVSLDASWDVERNEDGIPQFDAVGNVLRVLSRAVALSDGRRMGGRIEEVTGSDNYLGELAAQLDALSHLPAGGRVAIVFDATSPVTAMRAFSHSCARARNRFYAGSWLEHFIRLLRRQQLVVFMWQTSHVGSPLNEHVDIIADEAKGWDAVPVPRGPATFASWQWTGAQRGVHQWARVNAQRSLLAALGAACDETPIRSPLDLPLPALPPEGEAMSDALLAARAVCRRSEDQAGIGQVV